MVFIAYLASGLALNGLSYYGAVSGAETGQKWVKKCKKLTFAKNTSSTNKQNAFSEKRSKKRGMVEIIPCNSSLQILPVSGFLMTIPDHRSHSIAIHDQKLASQLFVFREPDPPRPRA
jgi:hypothetical protein